MNELDKQGSCLNVIFSIFSFLGKLWIIRFDQWDYQNISFFFKKNKIEISFSFFYCTLSSSNKVCHLQTSCPLALAISCQWLLCSKSLLCAPIVIHPTTFILSLLFFIILAKKLGLTITLAVTVTKFNWFAATSKKNLSRKTGFGVFSLMVDLERETSFSWWSRRASLT